MIALLSWFARASYAQQPTEPAPGAKAPAETEEDTQGEGSTIEIPPVDDLPSAIDTLDQAHEEIAIGPQLADWVPLPGALVRGRPLLRPLLSFGVHDRRFAAKAGLALGHQWWTMTEKALQLGGETRLELSAPFGGAQGYRVDLSTRAGPWLGPVGLRIGPLLRIDREQWGEDVLSGALSAGGSADLSLLLGPVVLLAGFEPSFIASGERGAAIRGPLPAVGTETTWRAGIGTTEKPLQFSFELLDRQTAIGPIFEGSLTLRIRAL